MLLSRSVCRDKVVKCRDIYAAPISSAFVASLSQQCFLTILLGDYHYKICNVATMKPGKKNSIFLKNGKMIIYVKVQVENLEFF